MKIKLIPYNRAVYFIALLLCILFFLGEAQCIYKITTSKWNPVSTRAIIYTVSACTPFGGIVGWLNIKQD